MIDDSPRQDLVDIVSDAHKAILEVYDTAFQVSRKSDDSPITEADRRAHEIIVNGLTRLDAQVPIVSEESTLPDFAERSRWPAYWLVDPLDGTKEFVKRNGEFTVNIALITGHEPRYGVVGRPTTDTVFFGDTKTQTALKVSADGELPIQTRSARSPEIRSVQSRRRADPLAELFLANLEAAEGSVERDFCGSSLKFLTLAEGLADLYIQPGGTSEWDTAAAHAVLEAAGGCVMTLRGETLVYNATEKVLNPPFIALGDASDTWRNAVLSHLTPVFR